MDELDQLFSTETDLAAIHSPDVNYDELIEGIVNGASQQAARFRNPRYLQRLIKTAEMLKMHQAGRISDHQFREVLSTSDFPILFGDILDRRLLDQYQETTPSWPSYMARGTVPDFRDSRIIAIDGLQSPYAPSYEKPELHGVRYDNAVTETGYIANVKVYEKGFALNWRMLVNRSLNFVSRFPELLARGARRTEEYLATSLFVDASGYNTTFFASGNANLVSGNPALSITGLKAALNTMYLQTDGTDPIEIQGVTLVVPPLLKLTAMELLDALSQEIVPPTSATGVRVLTPNWAKSIQLAVNWYLPLIDATANKHTTWYLFANPSQGRPAMQMTFLEGYEQPSLWQKTPNTQRVGGSVDPLMGDFNDMSTHYKGLHVVGGTLLSPKMAVVSNGSGS